ncbi:MAG TPA: hypothetical protein VFX59_18425 [Polyangiales bacterium]|nr:hypothetical protein [Polyangiales bacterium]
MFNSSILDAAIGVGFVFLLLSTVCTAVREGVEHWLKTRASYLEYAIRELLNDSKATDLAKDFFEHPLIQGYYQGPYKALADRKPSLLRRGRDLPSYIPAKAFASALLDMAARGPKTDALSASPDYVEATFENVRASVDKLQNPYVQRVLLSSLDAARGDLDRARQNIERWYDGAMDRVSGWYKRSSQLVILIVASLISVGLNVNTITIADHLYRDQSLRASVVAAAQNADTQLSYVEAQSNLAELQLPIGWSGGWGAPLNDAEHTMLREQRMQAWLAKHPEANAAQQTNAQTEIDAKLTRGWWNQLFAPVLGLMITAFAATLGAPFWFDILNRVMVIRASVKPHEKSPEEPSEDRWPRARSEPEAVPSAMTKQQPANDQHAEDPCGEPITESTDDAELPPARGGVERG